MKHLKKSLISKYVDNMIKDQKTNDAIKKHLDECVECRQVYDSYIKIDNFVKNFNVDIKDDLYLEFLNRKINHSKTKISTFRFSLSFALLLSLIFLLSFSLTLFTGRKNILKVENYTQNNVIDKSFSNFLSDGYSDIISTVDWTEK